MRMIIMEYLVPEIIKYDDTHTIIHVHVPPSAEVHSFKKIIYDRVDDADVKVTATGTIAQMYIRKQGIFTEKKIFPYAKLEDLRQDLLPKVRLMAQNHAGGNHPWATMDDMELLKSAGLYGRDIVTGDEGFNLAAIMLLGKDDVILNVAPAYVTDALVRKYSRYYSGQEPEFIEGDIFKIIVPLNDEYSYDFETNRIETDNADKTQESADKTQESADKTQESADKSQESADKMQESADKSQHKLVLEYVEKNGKITSRQAEELLHVKQRRAREVPR